MAATSEQLKKAAEVRSTLVKAMDELNMKYDADGNVFEFSFGGDDLPMHFRMTIDAERQLIILLSPQQYTIPRNKIVDAAMAIGHINYLLNDGSFDFDITDGTIAFRMTSSFRESLISTELLQYMIAVSVNTVDDYNDKLDDIGKGKLDAYKYIETL